MNQCLASLITWQVSILCIVICIITLLLIRYLKLHIRYKLIIHQLTKGLLGLASSRKGALCIILFFCSLAPMTYLCFLGKLDSIAYAGCMSAITVAVTAIFCHTQSRTDQILGTTQFPPPTFTPPPQFPQPSTIETTISSGGMTQNINGVPAPPVSLDKPPF